MRYKLPKKREKRKRGKNHFWFAWYPVVAGDSNDKRYLIWLEQAWKAYTMDLISYHI